MHVFITNFNGNPNVGLYGLVTDSYVLLGKETPETHDKEIEEALGLPNERVTIAGSSMISFFCR